MMGGVGSTLIYICTPNYLPIVGIIFRFSFNTVSKPSIISRDLYVSVASCERSFSILKLIKNYLRSTMGQSRLSGLALLSIESETVKDIDFDEVIDRFAALKTRKGKF
jgi:hypothetical protein